MRQYIPVNTDDLPDIFDITLAGKVYTLRMDYNPIADFYTLTIMQDRETLLEQEPLVLDQLVGIDIPDSRLPRTDIRVMDESNNAKDAGKGELGYDVQLYLDIIDPLGSEDDDPTIKPLGYDPNVDSDDLTDEEVSY
ncbi:phage baseplate plug family protein [Lactobacillus helveticus]|uniref:phage baseplate plug family protein n=1 Tax=Lactobacillus helveticus TaxID=1587 RepID=UPI00062A6B0A|nr:hypothetical protein [Lactobacillus helveticus]AKG66653.1 hypothetical protein TU99_04875 [Lactobacillus helveticus]